MVTFSEPPPLSDYEPKWDRAKARWNQLSPRSRQKLYQRALTRLAGLRLAADKKIAGSERQRTKAAALDRTNYRRWVKRYKEHGFDGLLSLRLPPAPEAIPDNIRQSIIDFRAADPNISVEKIVQILAERKQFTCSETSAKRILQRAGLARRRGPHQRNEAPSTIIAFGGAKLIEAALVETGCLDSMVTTVMSTIEALPNPEQPKPADKTGRDALGRFLSEYNERNIKPTAESLGPAFRSVEEKRQNLVPERLHVHNASAEVVRRKFLALLYGPLIGNGSWDGMRISRGELLSELCGYPYMPTTLDLFCRELKYAGTAAALWETHANLWFKLTPQCGEQKNMIVLYVDGTTTPIWTNLPSHETQVSQIGRVMPGLETVSFNSGYGAPLYMATHSGRAPLVKVVPAYLDYLDGLFNKPETTRLIIIDGEGCAVPFLEGLEKANPPRAWVTMLTEWILRNKNIEWCNELRPFRKTDKIRDGVVQLNNNTTDKQFSIRLVELHRRDGNITRIGASTLLRADEWSGAAIADIYFSRGPKQEWMFRELNQATTFRHAHAYGKKLVQNVTVINELESLKIKTQNARSRLERREAAVDEQREHVNEARKARALADAQLAEILAADLSSLPPVQALSLMHEQKEALATVDKLSNKLAIHEKKMSESEEQWTDTQQQLEKFGAREKKLAGRTEIYQHDTELDSLFGVLKVNLVLMVMWVLRWYLGGATMSAETFLSRMVTLPAQINTTRTHTTLKFLYNRRDPKMMFLLSTHCATINDRKLRLIDGKILQIEVELKPQKPDGRKKSAVRGAVPGI